MSRQGGRKRSCSICLHPRRAEIDAALRGDGRTGERDWSVAERFGLKEGTVGRHRREHLLLYVVPPWSWFCGGTEEGACRAARTMAADLRKAAEGEPNDELRDKMLKRADELERSASGLRG